MRLTLVLLLALNLVMFVVNVAVGNVWFAPLINLAAALICIIAINAQKIR